MFFLLATCFIVTHEEDPEKLIAFEFYNYGIQTVEELFNAMHKTLTLVRAEVFVRVLPLTKEMLDRIIP